jgi:hypothetical protein
VAVRGHVGIPVSFLLPVSTSRCAAFPHHSPDRLVTDPELGGQITQGPATGSGKLDDRPLISREPGRSGALVGRASRGANRTSWRRARDRDVSCGHGANARPIPIQPAISALTLPAVGLDSSLGLQLPIASDNEGLTHGAEFPCLRSGAPLRGERAKHRESPRRVNRRGGCWIALAAPDSERGFPGTRRDFSFVCRPETWVDGAALLGPRHAARRACPIYSG